MTLTRAHAEADAPALLRGLRSRGFDLRRPVFVAYALEFRAHRDVAYQCWHRAADDGWQSALYADETGWVVRVGRLVRPRLEMLDSLAAEAQELATGHGAEVRGVCIEDLNDDDVWERIALRARDEQSPCARDAVHDILAAPLPRTA